MCWQGLLPKLCGKVSLPFIATVRVLKSEERGRRKDPVLAAGLSELSCAEIVGGGTCLDDIFRFLSWVHRRSGNRLAAKRPSWWRCRRRGHWCRFRERFRGSSVISFNSQIRNGDSPVQKTGYCISPLLCCPSPSRTLETMAGRNLHRRIFMETSRCIACHIKQHHRSSVLCKDAGSG